MARAACRSAPTLSSMAKPLTPEKALEFAELLKFLAHFDKAGWIPPRTVDPDIGGEVARMEAQYGKSKALQGLRQSLGDILEMTSSRSLEWVQTFDQKCRAAGIKTISEYRVTYWLKYKRVLEGGRISNLEQFYMVSAVTADLVLPVSAEDRAKLERMLASYEV